MQRSRYRRVARCLPAPAIRILAVARARAGKQRAIQSVHEPTALSWSRVIALSALAPPETAHAGGEDGLVRLDPDHPGFRDPVYRRRRDAIARLALDYRDGDPAPHVDYTDAEQAVWRTVWQSLDPLHARSASARYLECSRVLRLDRERIPQLEAINRELAPATGFRLLPVAGLVSARTFLSYLGRGVFLSTQYLRHPSAPLYTPEPDLVHELVGHAATLADPLFAEINRRFGAAADRANDATLERIARLYWFTLEFGLCLEGGRPKAYGAGLLSSFGELGRFESQAELRPFDLDAIFASPYDPTDYQKILYVADGFEPLTARLSDWLASV